MTKLRTCNLRIPIETGRWENIPRQERIVHFVMIMLAMNCMYPTVTSARSCNDVGHLFWFTILAQHETNDVILYIHSVHKHRWNTFQRQNYKMRLKQMRLNWINFMQVKKILFTNVFFSWSLFPCLYEGSQSLWVSCLIWTNNVMYIVVICFPSSFLCFSFEF